MDKSWIRWLWRPIKKWRKPVQVAIQNRDVQQIILLKKSGADFSVKTKNGQSMLHLLAKKNNDLKKNDEEIFDLLISERSLDVNETDKNGLSALHFAAGFDNYLIARKLIEHGAKVDCRDKHMATPLYYAVSMGEYEVVELLLSRGANVNAKTFKGTRPIHYVHSGMTLDILVNYGAYVDAQDKAGQTALAEFISAGYFFLVERLCMYGADVANDIAAIQTMLEFDYKILLTIDTLTNHLAELMVANLLYPSKFLRNILEMNPHISKSVIDRVRKLKCKAVWLKRTYYDERTTVYDILHMDPNERCRFICGHWEEWQNFCRPLEFDEDLSHFYHVIVACGYQAQARSHLLKSAKEAWLELTNIGLPDLCVDTILSHLSNSELLRMVDGNEN